MHACPRRTARAPARSGQSRAGQPARGGAAMRGHAAAARLNTDAAQETLCAPLRLRRARDGSAETSTTDIPRCWQYCGWMSLDSIRIVGNVPFPLQKGIVAIGCD